MPVKPGGVPSPVKPGGPLPVKPVVPGSVSPVKPLAPGTVKPGSPPLAPVEVSKSGTSVIKASPPKETARITVKPSLPGGTPTVKPAGNLSTVKPAGSMPVVATAAGAAAVAAAKPGVKAAAPAATIPVAGVKPMVYQEDPNTLISTIAAGVGAVLTWGTAAILCYYSLFA
jgi:hypothetical protein